MDKCGLDVEGYDLSRATTRCKCGGYRQHVRRDDPQGTYPTVELFRCTSCDVWGQWRGVRRGAHGVHCYDSFREAVENA
jgi:hypothetical protein